MFGGIQAQGLNVLRAAKLSAVSLLLTMLVASPRWSWGQAQSPFSGSVPTGQATGSTLPLSLKEAFERALKYNLGVIESDQNTRLAHAARLRSLNALVPNISARLSATIEQINLAALGLS